MSYHSIFDVIGHVMVGPSSSHTAGACRIAFIARILFGRKPKRVEISLHGSFAETYLGHGTDTAILAGLLGIPPDDDRIPSSKDLIAKEGISYEIKTVDLGADYHPNTVVLDMQDEQDRLVVIGESIGGGNVVIKEINGLEAGFSGEFPTLVIVNRDRVGVIARIAETISRFKINIGNMKLDRDMHKKIGICWMELDSAVPEDLIKALEGVQDIISVRFINV
nr:L-serine ammonia-lyase, iron-sulfur-dependent subunit beta [Candidatus Sigynarchaeum springense]